MKDYRGDDWMGRRDRNGDHLRIIRSDDYPPRWRITRRAMAECCAVFLGVVCIILSLWFTAFLMAGAFNR